MFAKLLSLLSPTRSKTTDPYYKQIQYSQHVFIFGVLGRSSTTAFQRLLNSTGEICVWGEPGDYLVDRLATAICFMQEKMEEPNAAERKRILHDAFRKGNHAIAYPMAYNDWLPSAQHIADAFSEMWRPAIPVNRFGFKEIHVLDRRTLESLLCLYPNCRFAFVFRDPRTQWPSVQTMHWDYSQKLGLFLERYAHLAQIYMDFGGLFIENEALKDADRMRAIAAQLDLSSVDPKLIDDRVFAKSDKPKLLPEDEKTILDSDAFQLYGRMQKLESGSAAESL